MRKNNSKISGVYKITNTINNKFYIGSTCCFLSRKHHHFNNLLHNKHANKYLQKSYNKYKKENFKFEILVKCPKEYNLKMEQWFINNMKPNYNMQKIAGSNLGIKFSKEHRLKIGLSNKGIIRSEELKKTWSVIKKKNINHEHINFITTKAKLVNCKKIIQYSKEGIFIKEYNSLSEAAIAINGDVSTITKVCKNKLSTHRNFIFKYK
jgi:group I intron endonuclease